MTPILGSDGHREGLESWNKMDTDAQSALFRAMLHAAKNPLGLMEEWAGFCADVVITTRSTALEEVKPVTERQPVKQQGSIPATKPVDLKSLIGERVRE